MAEFYTSAFVRRLTKRKGKPWCGVLRYNETNPDYIPDQREPNQRRKAMGTRKNPDYVPDEREPRQRLATISKQVTKVFDPETVKTKTQANTELVKWRAKMEAEHETPDASLTVLKYVEHYIDGREKLATITPTTVQDYRSTARYLKRGGAKDIGDIIFRDLTPAMVEAWETSLIEAGLSGTTTLKAHRLIKQVCKYAYEIGDIPISPVRGFKAPKRSTGKPNALDAEGRMKAMVALSEMPPDPVVVAAQAALYTGMRRGEICGLTWANVDLEGVKWQDANETGPKIRVCQSLGEKARGTYIKAPKTASGRRIIPLSGGFLEVLKARRSRMWDEWSDLMQKLEIEQNEANFLKLYVIGKVDGRCCTTDALTQLWKRLSQKLDLVGTEGRRVTLHDLRHTFATSAITRGVDVSSVSAILGHAQSSTTLNMYTSHDSAAQRSASNIVANDLDIAKTGRVASFGKTGTEG